MCTSQSIAIAFFSSRRRHTRFDCDWSSDVCSSDLGTWKDLTDSVNFMAGNLTNQVRGIARLVTAVANGDLKQKLLVEAKGEIAELANTINAMTETLATFADQVTTVAREVGVDGRLGGQAHVPGAAGTWRDL